MRTLKITTLASLILLITMVAVAIVQPRRGNYGVRIPSTVGTAGAIYSSLFFNKRIKKPQTYINRDNGILTIMFDFSPDSNDSKNPPLMRFQVRLFDKNGQYLTSFRTKEIFTSTDDKFLNTTKLFSQGNVLQYPINTRDASFVAMVEFGALYAYHS